jgi:hypothetical protein
LTSGPDFGQPARVEITDQKISKHEKSFLNRSAVHEYALHVSATERAGKFTRVGADFLDRIEDKVRALVRAEVKSHPSVGQTLK